MEQYKFKMGQYINTPCICSACTCTHFELYVLNVEINGIRGSELLLRSIYQPLLKVRINKNAGKKWHWHSCSMQVHAHVHLHVA